jgi:FlaA1/EpsC-like NDP-sugar epimerase
MTRPRLTPLAAARAIFDAVLFAAALAISFEIRFEWNVPPEMVERFERALLLVVAIEYLSLLALGVHRFSWRFVGLREVIRILVAGSISTSILIAIRLVASLAVLEAYRDWVLVPLGVLLINGMLAFLLTVGARVVRRIVAEQVGRSRHARQGDDPVPTILIGAGQAGVLVAKEIHARPDLGIKPLAFVDDDRSKIGSVIHGLSVIGTTQQLAELTPRLGAREAIITIANASGTEMRRIVGACETARLRARTIPGLYEILEGKVALSFRNVAIEDLLRRDPVVLENESIAGVVESRTVFVSGAGGSIGSELCRQLCRFKPGRLVLFERSENALFNIHRELHARFPECTVEPVIGDITDEARLEAVFGEHAPAVVFHAAAHKHVPMMEWNPGEAIKNNVFGTKKLADAAAAHNVERFIMISTDKAINPTSVMGATKRAAELYVQALAQRSATRFVTVRFGNVLDSAGSVVPIFREQIAKGGPVTVTHPDMTRYFMTIPEACQLVLQAASMGQGGEIFILDMGEPVKIIDLARDLITLSGLRPDDDVAIEFVGPRPGEKLFEELSTDAENADKTRHPKIYVGRVKVVPMGELVAGLSDLAAACASGAAVPELRALLTNVVPEYQGRSSAPAQPAVRRVVPPRDRRADELNSEELSLISSSGTAGNPIPRAG